jgi:hypothetical protein
MLSLSLGWYLIIRIVRIFRPKELDDDGAFHQ